MTSAIAIAAASALALGACSKTTDSAPKVAIGADHVAAVNAAIPAELKGKIEFELGAIKEDKGRSSQTFKLAVPKGWKPGFMGALRPPDADNFGSKTMGDTKLGVHGNCDGVCEKKDWAAVSDKVEFSGFTKRQDGAILKDEKAENRRTLVYESKALGGEPADAKNTHIVTAWWDPNGTHYYVCRADVGAPVRGLAAAFEKACAKISGE